MSNKKTNNSLGLGTIIFIIFLILKLAGIGQVANWSWWWVTSPLWIPFLIIMLIGGIAFIIALLFNIFKK